MANRPRHAEGSQAAHARFKPPAGLRRVGSLQARERCKGTTASHHGLDWTPLSPYLLPAPETMGPLGERGVATHPLLGPDTATGGWT